MRDDRLSRRQFLTGLTVAGVGVTAMTLVGPGGLLQAGSLTPTDRVRAASVGGANLIGVYDPLVLDVSTYDYSTFDVDCLWAAGVRRIIIGVYCRNQPPSEARDMARRWQAKGGEVLAFYGLVYFGNDYYVLRDTKWAILLAKEFGVERVMLDAELDAREIAGVISDEPTPARRNVELARARKLVEDAALRPMIYTYRPWWVRQHANTAEFSDLELVYANYGTGIAAPIHFLGSFGFGGWSVATLHQYTSTVARCGRVRDHNYLFEPLENDMTPEEVRAIVREVVLNEDIEVDARLREVEVMRFKIIHLAANPDASVTAAAYKTLRAAGLVA